MVAPLFATLCPDQIMRLGMAPVDARRGPPSKTVGGLGEGVAWQHSSLLGAANICGVNTSSGMLNVEKLTSAPPSNSLPVKRANRAGDVGSEGEHEERARNIRGFEACFTNSGDQLPNMSDQHKKRAPRVGLVRADAHMNLPKGRPEKMGLLAVWGEHMFDCLPDPWFGEDAWEIQQNIRKRDTNIFWPDNEWSELVAKSDNDDINSEKLRHACRYEWPCMCAAPINTMDTSVLKKSSARFDHLGLTFFLIVGKKKVCRQGRAGYKSCFENFGRENTQVTRSS
jgi:hypothetical protein